LYDMLRLEMMSQSLLGSLVSRGSTEIEP
jgi:hypothetical protein